jgi:RsiW-degrading membrane proteinase PrsW (M82 family)
MDKVARFIKNVLIGGFIVILSLAYYELSDRFAPVTLFRDPYGHSVFETDHNTFFYVAFIFFMVLNILISLIANLTKSMPLSRLRVPNRDFWLKDADSQEHLRVVLVAWVYGFAIILNAFMIILTAKIWFVNRSIGGQLYEYGLLALTLVLLLLVWIGFIFYRLRIRRAEYIT